VPTTVSVANDSARYNSVVFSSSTSNVSAWVVAQESYLSGGHWDNYTLKGYSTILNGTLDWNNSVGVGSSFGLVSYIHNNYIHNPSAYANVSNYECILRSMDALKWRPNTILISSDPANTTGQFDTNSTILQFGVFALLKPGILNGFCHQSSLPCRNFSSVPPSVVDTWNWDGASIRYCLIETGGVVKDLTELCYLQCTPSVSQIRLSRFSLAKPRNTLVSAVSSFTPARRCLLGVADGLAGQSQLKRHGNAVVNGFVYFVASGSGTSQLMLTTS